MKFLIVLNGDVDKKSYEKEFFLGYDKIICCDGGYNKYKEIPGGRNPDYIIGDFDSIQNKSDLEKFQKDQIIFKDNQNETDFQFAIKKMIEKYKEEIKHIDVLYFNSKDRIDHFLINILSVIKITKNIEFKFITYNQETFVLRKEIAIKNKKGATLSIIPITQVKNIVTTGLHWPLVNTDLELGYVSGISNIVTEEQATISIDEGVCLVIVTNI